MIYLDNAATSFPKAPGVAEAVYDYLKNVGSNAGRSSYSAARTSDSIIFETREKLAKLFKAKDDSRFLFTLNATEALNTAILGTVKPGQTVLTSPMEHNSVMRPLRFLEANHNVNIIRFECDGSKTPCLEAYQAKLAEKPDHVVITACSNVTGAIAPFNTMAELAKEVGATFILDASQAAGLYPIKLDDSEIDIMCFPGHKGLLGPTGTGAFFLREGIDLPPLKYGGTGSRSDQEIQPDYLPDRYESGTMNIAGITGLNKALDFILSTSVEQIWHHKLELIAYFLEGLQEIKNLRICSPTNLENQIGVISVVPENMSISELTYELDRHDIAVRMGMHCAPAAHKTIGTFKLGGTVRFSPGYFTTKEEIAETLQIIKKVLL